MENGKPETRINFNIKTGDIIPGLIPLILYLGTISSGLRIPDIIILEPY